MQHIHIVAVGVALNVAHTPSEISRFVRWMPHVLNLSESPIKAPLSLLLHFLVYQTLTPGGLCELFVAVIRSFAYIFGPGASEEEAAVVQLMWVLTEGEEVGAARLPSNFVFHDIYSGAVLLPNWVCTALSK